MPTENPKVSAYIPQHIFNLFKAFYEERNLSMSQAVGLIFAEYFGVDQEVNHLGRTGLVLDRLQLLEEKVSNLLSGLGSELPDTVAELFGHLDALDKRMLALEESKLPSVLPGELPIESLTLPEVEVKDEYEQNSRPDVDYEVNQEDSNTYLLESFSNPLESLLGVPSDEMKPIPGNKLSHLRFGLSKDTVSGSKRNYKNSPEKFIDWTRDKDPDGIPWKYVEFPERGYVPAEELSSELKSRLLQWISENCP